MNVFIKVNGRTQKYGIAIAGHKKAREMVKYHVWTNNNEPALTMSVCLALVVDNTRQQEAA